MIQLYAKTQWCYLKVLSESTSSSFWSNMMVCKATIFLLALWPLIFLMLVVHLAKPLSPGEWTDWMTLSACNHAFFFLSKTEVLQNLH